MPSGNDSYVLNENKQPDAFVRSGWEWGSRENRDG